MRVVAAAALLALIVACASAPAAALRVGEPSVALASALSNTGLQRVFFRDEATKPAAVRAGNQPPRLFGLPEGEVVLRFIVDTTGRAEVGTFEIAGQGQQELADALAGSLRSWRFYPAELHGRPVRQLVTARMVKVRNHADIRVDPAPRP